MTDQELQKIAEKITNTVSDNDGRLKYSKIVDSVSFQLRQVRDAQEEKLQTAMEALGKISSGMSEDMLGTTSLDRCELISIAKEALEKIGGGE